MTPPGRGPALNDTTSPAMRWAARAAAARLLVPGAPVGRPLRTRPSTSEVRDVSSRLPISLRIALVVFVAAIPYQPAKVLFAAAVPRITGVLFIGLCLWYRSICFRRVPAPVRWFAGYWLLAILYAFFTPAELRGYLFELERDLAVFIVLFWAASNLLQDERLLRYSLLSLVISFALMAAGSLLRLPGFRIEVHTRIRELRTSALGWELNTLGALSGWVALIAVGLLLDGSRRKRRDRIVLVVSLMLVLGVLVETGSRGGLLSFAVASLLYVLPLGRRGRRIVAIGLGVVMLLGVVYIVTRDPMAVHRWTEAYQEGDTAGRDVIFASLLSMIRERPLLGWGPIEVYYELGSRLNLVTRGPHNLYLGLLAGVGFIGSFFFFFGLWLCTRDAWRARRGSFRVLPLALMAGVIFANLSHVLMWERSMWFAMAVATGAGSAKGLGTADGLGRKGGETAAKGKLRGSRAHDPESRTSGVR